MNHADKRQSGFTLIELLLAMTFVSVLLLIIALCVIQLSNIYHKGLTMRSVDQAGRVISDDIRRTISTSAPFSVKDVFVDQKFSGAGTLTADGGRFCVGNFSYIWNYGHAVNTPINIYSKGTDNIRFVKVRDRGGQYCANLGLKINPDDAVEMLSGDGAGLAIQSFSVEEVADDPTVGQALYRIELEIGTNDQSTLDQAVVLNSIDTTCKPPSDEASVQTYCAVNKFDFTAQAGNKGGVQ